MLKNKVIHQDGNFRLKEENGVLIIEMKPKDLPWQYFGCLHNFVYNYIDNLQGKIDALEGEVADLENDAWGDAFDRDDYDE
jgi:hypothetical protein